MSTLVVGKKEFTDGIRSRALLALIGLFVLFTVYETYTVTSTPELIMTNPTTQRTAAAAIEAMASPLFIMLTGILVGYNAISGERASGSLKLLLGLPHTRREIMVGKFLGRAALLIVAMLAGFATGGVLTVAFTGTLLVGDYLLRAAMSMYLGVVYISIAVAVSSAIRTQARATRTAVGVAIVFYSWSALMYTLGFVLGNSSPLYQLLTEIDPQQAYSTAITLLRDHLVHPANAMQFPLTAGFGPHPPFYLQHWFAFVVLLCWLVVPLGIAYVRFQRMDLR